MLFRYLLPLSFFCFGGALTAQSAILTKDTSIQNGESLFNYKAGMNRVALDEALATGQGYFIDAPPVEYDVDPERLYYHPDFQHATVVFTNNQYTQVPVRFQLLNQKFEVIVKGNAFDLDNDRIAEVLMGDQQFMLFPDPMRRIPGRVIHQLHFASPKNRLFEQHVAEWAEAQLAGSYGKIENKKNLNRYSNLLLQAGSEVHQIRSHKDFLTALNIGKRSKEYEYIKENKLKLNRPEDAVRLLEMMFGSGEE